MSKENLCKIDWTRESMDPKKPGQLSTRKVQYEKDGEICTAFRLCLERQGISDAAMMADNVITHLYVTIFGSTEEKRMAFEKKFDAKTLSGFYAERRKVACDDYVRFYSEDSNPNAKYQHAAGDVVRDANGDIKIYKTIDVDVLLDEKDELLYGESNARYTAKGNLAYQIDRGWAQYADEYFGENGSQEPPAPQNTEPPIVPPGGNGNGYHQNRGNRR